MLVVASAPGFPHGVVDDVPGIAGAAAARGVPCHVDCCLGGFVLPFARRLGRRVPDFDFSVPGVTSMSADTHKFGQGHKGSSVVLYRGAARRRCQYTSITDWTGGLYISPGFAGSRSGAVIATAWTALVHLGEDGYLAATAAILDVADAFRRGLRDVPGVQVLGKPEASVVAFKSTDPCVMDAVVVGEGGRVGVRADGEGLGGGRDRTGGWMVGRPWSGDQVSGATLQAHLALARGASLPTHDAGRRLCSG